MTYNLGSHKRASLQPVKVQTRPDQVLNDAGGYVFQADDMTRFDRFLILGVLSGTLYVEKEAKIEENLDLLRDMIRAGKAQAMIERAADVSLRGLAPRNDPAIITLALVLRYGSDEDKRMVAQYVPSICRTGTHILHLAKYVDDMGAWGRAPRRAISNWYTQMTPGRLAFQVAKYQNRDGWTHRDVLRLAHVKPSAENAAILKWIVKGTVPEEDESTRVICGLEKAKGAEHPEWTIKLIQEYGLSREMVMTDHLTDPGVMVELFKDMPMTAMLRNLGNYAAAGLHNVGSEVRDLTVKRLTSQADLHAGRIHPLDVAIATLIYKQGHGVLGKKTWTPAPPINRALDEAFQLSFRYQEPTGKKIVIAVDVSGSMDTQTSLSGLLSCGEAAALMAFVFTRIERDVTILRFNTTCREADWSGVRTPTEMWHMISMGGGTNMSSVFSFMTEHRVKSDLIMILSDMQTWADPTHPYEALRQYRAAINPAKFVSACVDANSYRVAAPEDMDVLDVVGFDASLPRLVQTFLTLGA